MGFNIHGKIPTKFTGEDYIRKLEEKIMRLEKIEQKPKKKINFDKLFPAPKNNENMGMDNFGNKKKDFEGVF